MQKYLHDMAAWDALTVEEQERVIGRAKLSNVEMDDEVKPSNSHVALNTIVEPDGTQRQILRENMPFGSLGAGEFGTYFIGYAATPSVTELMLQHMFLGDPPGNYDRILDFSTAVTGSLFFVPTADFLDDPPPLPARRTRAPGMRWMQAAGRSIRHRPHRTNRPTGRSGSAAWGFVRARGTGRPTAVGPRRELPHAGVRGHTAVGCQFLRETGGACTATRHLVRPARTNIHLGGGLAASRNDVLTMHARGEPHAMARIEGGEGNRPGRFRREW